MRGEVTLRVECLMPEKLVERATARGARFDTVRRVDEKTLVLQCDPASARCALALCERFNLPARVTGLRGPAALRRYARRRATLPLGLALAAVLCALFLGRFWMIDVAFSGETARLGDAAALRRQLAALGVRPGIPRSLDAALLAQTLQAQAGDYSYVGVHAQGIRLLVEAVPESPAPAVYDVEAARDLVCARDGIVERAVARSGTLCVKPGDAVRRGQLLIRGEERSGPEETRPIAALGEVLLRTWYQGGAALPLETVRTEDTGRASTACSLTALGFEWPIVPGETYDSQREEREYLPVGGLFLPVELRRVTRRETRQAREKADLRALKDRLSILALADAEGTLAREGPAEYAVLRRWTDYEIKEGALHARAVIEIQADAAITREALQGG